MKILERVTKRVNHVPNLKRKSSDSMNNSSHYHYTVRKQRIKKRVRKENLTGTEERVRRTNLPEDGEDSGRLVGGTDGEIEHELDLNSPDPWGFSLFRRLG